ncbi:MAG: YaaL family protein [Anaerovoracaceae bacterium]|jgi:hypothetical protein
MKAMLIRSLPQSGKDELMKQIQDARNEWLSAENRFNQFTDPYLIDRSIYEMMAAQSKYQYLLQCAKEKGIHV